MKKSLLVSFLLLVVLGLSIYGCGQSGGNSPSFSGVVNATIIGTDS